MALANSLSKFRSELSDATSRNLQHSRPAAASTAGPVRSSTPKPGDSNKRTHDSAFASSNTNTTAAAPAAVGHSGHEILTQVFNAVKYLREKDGKAITFDAIIGYLSLPNDAQKNIPYIKQALQKNDRVEFLPKSDSGTGREMFKYRPLHPVTNAEELKTYLSKLDSAQGIPVKELKDGWPDCASALDTLESQGFLLVVRNKKDNTPRTIYADSPSYHILHPATGVPQKADADFVEVWSKTKLPASEIEIRTELERAGLTPTSAVREVKVDGGLGRKKERKRGVRKGGKTTNSHMLGILKDYSRR